MAAATTRPGDQNLRVLVVSADPQLAEEFRSAFERIPGRGEHTETRRLVQRRQLAQQRRRG